MTPINRIVMELGKSILSKVALLLTDLEMPEMHGFTLTRNINLDSAVALSAAGLTPLKARK